MPYPVGHRAAVRKRIIDSARRLFNRHGFECVSLNQIMAGAGLTHGVARSGVSAKRAFETVFRAMVSVLERSLISKSRRHRTTAQCIAAMSIGGMVVARTMVDRALADELRAACLSVALELGGWGKKKKSKNSQAARAQTLRAA